MSSIEHQIAQQNCLKSIWEIGNKLGLDDHLLDPYGHFMAKVNRWHEDFPGTEQAGKVILVTAMNPTPAGEGKTVTSIGLNDALNRLGKRSVLCLREPSLGPYFGMKGGATGGGYAQVGPTEKINLHFTGDFHAITSAHNLLTAMIDNSLHWGNALDLDSQKVTWPRVLDMNDRNLRHIVSGLGGKANGFTREADFDITAASEIMAIIALAKDRDDLKARLSRITIGQRKDGSLLYAYEMECMNAMLRLLEDALKPNLIQSFENNPVLMHAGPFANIAHGCNSVAATETACNLGEYVVTEAGFGSELGAEKFFDIKCRQSGITPSAATCVVTIRSLKMHGNVAREALAAPDAAAVRRGLSNLGAHLDNLFQYGLPVVVAINHMTGDTEEEIQLVQDYCADKGVQAVIGRHWAEGSSGAVELAQTVVEAIEKQKNNFRLLYPDHLPLAEKLRSVAQKVYKARDVNISVQANKQLEMLEDAGWGALPVCMAKTQYSFSSDPKLMGAPEEHTLPIRDVRLSSGAGFVVARCGDIMTMPGLPRRPASMDM